MKKNLSRKLKQKKLNVRRKLMRQKLNSKDFLSSSLIYVFPGASI
jgi:hypothetical protein